MDVKADLAGRRGGDAARTDTSAGRQMIANGRRTDSTSASGAPIVRSRRFWAGWMLAFGGSLLVVLLASLPPFVGEQARTLLMLAFSGVCHQIAERSPHIEGIQLAVCHRCYAIYWGLPVAALLYVRLIGRDGALNRWARLLIPLSLVPLGIDWGLDVLGVWTNTPQSRIITGAIFGLVGGLYLARALASVFVARQPADNTGSLVRS